LNKQNGLMMTKKGYYSNEQEIAERHEHYNDNNCQDDDYLQNDPIITHQYSTYPVEISCNQETNVY
jgi:hypothetical protein